MKEKFGIGKISSDDMLAQAAAMPLHQPCLMLRHRDSAEEKISSVGRPMFLRESFSTCLLYTPNRWRYLYLTTTILVRLLGYPENFLELHRLLRHINPKIGESRTGTQARRYHSKVTAPLPPRPLSSPRKETPTITETSTLSHLPKKYTSSR